MKIILTLCAALLLFTQIQVAAAPPDEDIMLNPEVSPSFEGGDQINFLRWVSQKIVYPEKALEQKIEGKVVTSFIIEKDGKLTSSEILASPDTLLSKAVLLALEGSPLWTPGTVDGDPVHTRLILPFPFKLPTEEPVYTEAETEIMPMFRGKDKLDEFRKWLGKQIYRNKKLNYREGKIVVSFIIETDGTVKEVDILRSTIKYSFTNEIVQIIKQSEWSPGYIDGKAVRVKYTLPVNFHTIMVVMPTKYVRMRNL